MTPPESTSPEGARRPRRGHGRVTLHDIAQEAGVTRITVSRYLREPRVVAADTAARIQAAVDTLGYVPNHQAGQLASGQSRIVAALIPNIGSSIFAETIQGLSEGLAASGHELMLMSTGYSLDREVEQLRVVMGWSPAALIVTGLQHLPATRTLLLGAAAAGTPVIQLWEYQEDAQDPGLAQVGFNHREVGRSMAQHLMAAGHQRLAFVDSGVAEDYRAHERGLGFAEAAAAQGAKAQVLRAPLGDSFDAGRETLRTLRKRHPRTTGVAFANDQLACGALLEAPLIGVQVPRDLVLLGFGDFPIGRQLTPSLSTIRPPREEMGRVAAAMALESIRNQTPPVSQRLSCELLERGSTRAP